MDIIAEYQGKPTLEQFALTIENTGKEYGNCLTVVENNSLGISILEKLIEKQYPNLYYSVKGTHEYVDQVQAESMSNSVPGFTTSTKTRPLIIAKLEEFIRNKLINIYSSRVINEFKTFIWQNNKAQAMRSYHDDLVMALAIGCWVRDTALTINQREVEYKKAMVSSMMLKSKTFQTSNPDAKAMRQGLTDEQRETKQQYSDFVWLLKG